MGHEMADRDPRRHDILRFERRLTGLRFFDHPSLVLEGHLDRRANACVILDGQATTHGDPARGARFNSAVRYVTSAAGKALAVVVSENGFFDVLPSGKTMRGTYAAEGNVNGAQYRTAVTSMGQRVC